MRLVLEGLLFGAFVLLLPLFLLPKGLALFKHYLMVLLTLEMIAPLYAITHLIIMSATASYGAASIHDPSGDGLNLATQMGLAMIHQDMAALAGRVSLALPFIAYALVAGSGYALMQFAHSVIAGPAESAAGIAAGEITTGNYSFGNTTLDTQQMANSTRYHHDDNITAYSGMISASDTTGGITGITPDSRLIFHASPGMSNLNSHLGLSHGLEQQASQSYEASMSHAATQAQSYSEAQSSVLREALDWHETRGQGTSTESSVQQSNSVQLEQGLDRLSQLTQDFAKSYGLTHHDAAQVVGEAAANVGFNWKFFGVGASVKHIASTDHQYQEALQGAEKLLETEGYRQAMNQIARASQDESLRHSDEVHQRVSDNLSSAFDDQATARSDIGHSLQQAHTAREALTQVKSDRAQYDDNLQEQFYQWLPKQSLAGSDVAVEAKRGWLASGAHSMAAADQTLLSAIKEQVRKNLHYFDVDDVDQDGKK